MSKAKYYKLQDEESKHPFLDDDKTSLDSIPEDPHAGSTTRTLSKRQKLFITCFVAVSLLVVVVVCVAMTQGSAFLERESRLSSSDRKFTLDEIFSGKFSFERYEADWVSDQSYLHTNHLGVIQYNMDTVDTTTIMTPNETQESQMSEKELNAEKTHFLFANNTKTLYRHSFYADYYIKNLKTGKIKKLRTPADDTEQIRYCSWGPVGIAVIFVHKCNIYYVPDAENGTYYLLTANGVPKKVFNGVPDWVYEEEIISSTHAIEFSPDGKYMSYVMFNATLVPFYRFPKYGPASNMYPSIEKIAYPKAGFPNPTIRITVVDLEKAISGSRKGSRNHLKPPKEISQGDYYYAMMQFNKQNDVYIQWLNRAQNKSICMLYAVNDSLGTVVQEHETPNGWIDDDYQKPLFSKDGSSYYVTMLPGNVPGKGAFRHLAKVSIDDRSVRNNIEFLTFGNFTVQDIKCWNPDEEVVFFRSTEMSTRYRHVYSYDINTKERKCVSCGLIKDSDGTNCTYYYPSFSKDCSWMVLLCQGPFLPKCDMYGLKSKRKVVLITNNSTREALKDKDVPVNYYYKITNSDGFEIPVKETRPKNFDPNRKYAILFDVYGGPNTQKVTSKFRVKFDWYFVSNDIILVEFDARGTGFYGYKFLYAVYRNLGYYESKDAIDLAKYLQKQSYVDPDRIAIWGWSYGGFYSATTLAMSQGSISTAVAVAPVTDWRYYDTVYSERYMGFPSKEDNLAGYERTSVMYRAKDFAGKNFMLIHGTADDNVHFQNSAQLAGALINAKVNFRSQFYTDRRHSIESRGHVFYLIADYLLSHLGGKKAPLGGRFGYADSPD